MSLKVAQANALLDSAKSEADLRNIIAQLDTSTPGTTTVLYSGSLNGKSGNDAVHTMAAIAELKKDPNLRILDNTEAFKFMDVMDERSLTYNAKLYDALERVFGSDPRDWRNNTTAGY